LRHRRNLEERPRFGNEPLRAQRSPPGRAKRSPRSRASP